MALASTIAAMIVSLPAQLGQCSKSKAKTRLSSRAQGIRAFRGDPWVVVSALHAEAAVVCCGALGTTDARSLEFGAATP